MTLHEEITYCHHHCPHYSEMYLIIHHSNIHSAQIHHDGCAAASLTIQTDGLRCFMQRVAFSWTDFTSVSLSSPSCPLISIRSGGFNQAFFQFPVFVLPHCTGGKTSLKNKKTLPTWQPYCTSVSTSFSHRALTPAGNTKTNLTDTFLKSLASLMGWGDAVPADMWTA